MNTSDLIALASLAIACGSGFLTHFATMKVVENRVQHLEQSKDTTSATLAGLLTKIDDVRDRLARIEGGLNSREHN